MNKKNTAEEFQSLAPWLRRIMEDWKRTCIKIDKLKLKSSVPKSEEKKSRQQMTKWSASIDCSKFTGWQKRWIFYGKRCLNRRETKDWLAIDPREPTWVTNAEDSSVRSWASSVNMRAIKEKPALTIGGILGHQYAAWAIGTPGMTATVAQIPGELGLMFRQIMESARPLILGLIKRSLTLAVSQPLSESREFIRGFSVAIQKGTLQDGGALVAGTGAAKIKFTMLLFEEFVRRGIENDQELYEWLVSILGEEVVWDRKALWKLRSDMGLDFYRGPGRPRKY